VGRANRQAIRSTSFVTHKSFAKRRSRMALVFVW
jgi:hypothetical protein